MPPPTIGRSCDDMHLYASRHRRALLFEAGEKTIVPSSLTHAVRPRGRHPFLRAAWSAIVRVGANRYSKRLLMAA
jgi:hypothetical protein